MRKPGESVEKRKNDSLGELLIVIAILLIIATTAIPNLVRAAVADYESFAVSSIPTQTPLGVPRNRPLRVTENACSLVRGRARLNASGAPAGEKRSSLERTHRGAGNFSETILMGTLSPSNERGPRTHLSLIHEDFRNVLVKGKQDNA